MTVEAKPKQSQTFQFPEVRVVEASAGSGKTYALAKRYVQLLLNPGLHLEQVPIRNILALTFTNKASFEMKARILEFLKKLALGRITEDEAKNILEPIGVTKEMAQAKAYSVMDALIHNYNFFQVQTIDKFINALLSGCAFKVGLTANFKIKTNAKEYLEHSLDEMIDKALTDPHLEKLFNTFLNQYLFLENRTGWFPKEDILSIVCALYRQFNTHGLNIQASLYTSEDLVKLKRTVMKDMKSLKKTLPAETDKRFVNSFEKFLKANTNSFDIDSISDYFAREELPVRKNAGIPKEAGRIWQNIKENLKLLSEQESFSLFNPYIHIFSSVKDGFYNLSAKDDVLFLEELNKRAGRLFDDDFITVEELYYRLATRFQHYLIDEFQDTSRLQWKNIEKMAEEALSTGGSLFYVGDRKQAIYGFRGGEVQLFDDVRGGFGAFNVQNELLTNNWRSQKSIVEFNNNVFSFENLKSFLAQKEQYEKSKNKKNRVTFAGSDLEELEKVYGKAQQSFQPENDGGYIRMEYIDVEKKEDRDEILREKILNLIRDLKKRYAYKDIAILTRGNKEVEQLTNWLLEEGILVESERTSNVQEHPLIRELISFLKFLNSPIDNFAFTSFILGEVFSKASGISEEELHNFVFKLRERLHKEKDLYIYTEFRRRYPGIWDAFIDEFFKNVGLYPLYELLVSMVRKFDILNNFADSQGYFMHLLELIKKKEEDHNDISSFLEYFEELEGEDVYVHVTDSDAIKILTVHKSKGLEFPVVILPYLGMDVQVGSSGDNQQSYVLQKGESSVELLRLKNKYYNFSDSLYSIYANEYKKALLSEINNVYVAMTRPQHELYGFIPKRVGNNFNYLKFLIPEDTFEMGSPGTSGTSEPAKGHSAPILKLPKAEYHDWIDYLGDEFQTADEVRNRRHRLKGSIIHGIFSYIGNCEKQDLNKTAAKAVLETSLRFKLDDKNSKYEALIKKIIKSKNIKPFFYVKDGEVFNEKELVNAYGHTKRIDRLIVKKDEAWIVDFKSSAEGEEKYIEQVNEYKEMIKDIYKKSKVRGFLVYLDTAEAKEV